MAHRGSALVSTNQFSVQTFMVFMPVSASVLVLNMPLSTTVVVVVVGFLSTMVHFLVSHPSLHSIRSKLRSAQKPT